MATETSGDVPTPGPTGADRVLQLLHGDERIADVSEAKELIETLADALQGELDPVTWVEQVMDMILQTEKALETEERGCFMRGWCYAAAYGALDMDGPPEPVFSGSLQGPEQDELDRTAWRSGVGTARAQLADGVHGVGLRNRVLLRVAQDGTPSTTVTAMWQAACAKSGDTQLAQAYPALGWPDPTGA